jgi:hypothetical protein
MAIKVCWDNDAHTAVLVTFDGRFTWEEFEGAWTKTTALYDTVDHPVDTIYDMRRIRVLPANMVSYMRRKFPSRHPKGGLIAAVGLDKTMELLWQTFTALVAPHLKASFFDVPDEAREYLQQQRASAEAQPGL